jgi:hypothetical protein
MFASGADRLKRDVLGKQGNDRLEIPLHERIDEALDGVGDLRLRRPYGRLLAAIGLVALERRARPLDRAVDRGRARVKDVGDLPRREAESIAKDQCSALAGRKVVERGDEGSCMLRRPTSSAVRRASSATVGSRRNTWRAPVI